MTRVSAAPTAPGRAKSERPGPTVGDIVLLTSRVLMGGVFLFAAYAKLHDPQSFSESIQAFRIVEADPIVLFSTYALPCVEAIAGVALILGLWTRAAAFVIVGLLVMFIVAIVSVLLRHLDVHCGCFGKFRLVCGSEIAWCKVWENSVLTAITAIPLFAGAGRLSADAALERRE